MIFSEENNMLLEEKINTFIQNYKKEKEKEKEGNKLIENKIKTYKKLKNKINNKRNEIKHIKDNMYNLNGSQNRDRKLYYCYNGKYYEIQKFTDLDIDDFRYNQIDYKISCAINKKIKNIIDKNIEDIEKEIKDLMKKVIEIEVDFIKQDNFSLINVLGLNKEKCSKKLAGCCANLIDNGFPMFNYYRDASDLSDLQYVIEENIGYCNWYHDKNERYYYRHFEKEDQEISLIEYYYMLTYFGMDFDALHNTLCKNHEYKEYVIHDYKYLDLYIEIGGNDMFNKI